MMSARMLLRSRKFWLLFVVLAFAMQVGVKYVWENDAELEASRSWLVGQNDLISQVGTVGDIQVTKSINFQGDASTPPYNDYTMLVLGAKGRAMVIVRAFIGEGPSERFELVSISVL
ncbi:Uncharacterised protein [Halioglobus japonicus]|nr:Uncharacterised protein [Halioglobus japonicus]